MENGEVFGLKKILIVMLSCLIYLSGCAAGSTDDSYETVAEPEEIELGETSFDLELSAFEYNKEENSLLVEYETGLPDRTEVIIGVNPGFPIKERDQYSPYFNYTQYLMQEVETVVYDGKISYELTDQEFDTYKLPAGTYFLRIVIPMSETANPSFYDQLRTEEDFLSIYPKGEITSDTQSSTYSFFDWEEVPGRWVYFYDKGVELENGHTVEEINDSFSHIDYREILKNPNKFKDERAQFTGTVLEIHENEISLGETETYLRLDVGNDDVIYIDYFSWSGMEEVFEGDVITVQGRMTGSKTYESVAGYQITIPSMEAVTYLIE